MAEDDFNMLIELNDNIINENIINDEIMLKNENDRYENIIILLGLNPKINYPLKIIQQGIIDMCMFNTHNNTNKYSRTYKFRDDSTSKKICEILYGSTINCVSIMGIGSRIRNIYRHYKYTKIVLNIDNNKTKSSVPETLGFNYDNPRWKPLDSLFIC